MHLDTPESPPDTPAQRQTDRRRLLRAFNASLACVLMLTAIFTAQASFDWRALAVVPQSIAGLVGVLTAPLLHGSIGHLAANAASILLLGTLAGTVYPRTTRRALPLLWLGSGLGAWLLGDAGSHHLGASGLTHGLMFVLFVLGLLRRDRPAVAAAMIAFALYGGMLLTILPRELDVSWQSHLGGALAGVASALLWRRSDPLAPRRRYSWEIEDALAEDAARADREQFEPPSPHEVPVLWRREAVDARDTPRGAVLPFARRGDAPERSRD
ncbi:MAG: rhomboid family intramembrane serine protease [Luteimonas sp.]